MGCLTILSDNNTSSPNPLLIKLAHTISYVLCTPAESRARNQHPIANLSRIPSDKFTNPRMHSIFAPAFGSELWDHLEAASRNNATKSESPASPCEFPDPGCPAARAHFVIANSELQGEDNTEPKNCTEWRFKHLNISRSRRRFLTCDCWKNLPWYKTQFLF